MEQIQKDPIKDAVHYILQNKIANEIWYESKSNDERLGKLLSECEVELVSYIRDTVLTTTLKHLEEGIKELGHQQDDDTIWCNMDDVLSLIKQEITKLE